MSMGRRKGSSNFEATAAERAQVRVYAGVGLTHEQIRMTVQRDGIPISIETLTRHFETELAIGKAEVLGKIASNVAIEAMTKGENWVACSIFYLKTQGGWRETNRQELAVVDPETDAADAEVVAVRLASLIEGVRRRRKAKPATPTQH